MNKKEWLNKSFTLLDLDNKMKQEIGGSATMFDGMTPSEIFHSGYEIGNLGNYAYGNVTMTAGQGPCYNIEFQILQNNETKQILKNKITDIAIKNVGESFGEYLINDGGIIVFVDFGEEKGNIDLNCMTIKELNKLLNNISALEDYYDDYFDIWDCFEMVLKIIGINKL